MQEVGSTVDFPGSQAKKAVDHVRAKSLSGQRKLDQTAVLDQQSPLPPEGVEGKWLHS